MEPRAWSWGWSPDPPVKLDELPRAVQTAHTSMADVEDEPETVMARLLGHYQELAHGVRTEEASDAEPRPGAGPTGQADR